MVPEIGEESSSSGEICWKTPSSEDFQTATAFLELSELSHQSMLIRLPPPQCFCPRGRKLRPWSEKNSDQNSDHPRLCIYWGKEKLGPWSELPGRENSDHGLSFGCFWGRGRRGGSQSNPSIEPVKVRLESTKRLRSPATSEQKKTEKSSPMSKDVNWVELAFGRATFL